MLNGRGGALQLLPVGAGKGKAPDTRTSSTDSYCGTDNSPCPFFPIPTALSRRRSFFAHSSRLPFLDNCPRVTPRCSPYFLPPLLIFADTPCSQDRPIVDSAKPLRYRSTDRLSYKSDPVVQPHPTIAWKPSSRLIVRMPPLLRMISL
jgi:hypothetical protein